MKLKKPEYIKEETFRFEITPSRTLSIIMNNGSAKYVFLTGDSNLIDGMTLPKLAAALLEADKFIQEKSK